ncbi:MAG: hypothetical protein ACJ76F_10065 [Bacteroidia bacterium]
MNKKTILYSILVGIFFSSCFRDHKKYDFSEAREPEAVELKLRESSALFNEQYFKVSMDSLDRVLLLRIEFKNGLKDFPFPKDKEGKELTATSFHFELYCNGQPVQGADFPIYARNQRVFYLYGYNDWLGKTIDFSSDTIDLKTTSFLKYEIPYFAFNKLKKGMKDFELKISQGVFCSSAMARRAKPDPSLKDTVFVYLRSSVPLSILKTKVAFRLNIPPIYKTALANEIIELRNDSVYSPAGSDNTIWNSSYPDMYWTISHPLNVNYVRSNYQKSTSQYTGRDTFYVFHYGMNDTISIGIWDHDNLSSDDYLASHKFAMSQFKPDKISRFGFGAVRRMDIKSTPYGIINP